MYKLQLNIQVYIPQHAVNIFLKNIISKKYKTLKYTGLQFLPGLFGQFPYLSWYIFNHFLTA